MAAGSPSMPHARPKKKRAVRRSPTSSVVGAVSLGAQKVTPPPVKVRPIAASVVGQLSEKPKVRARSIRRTKRAASQAKGKKLFRFGDGSAKLVSKQRHRKLTAQRKQAMRDIRQRQRLYAKSRQYLDDRVSATLPGTRDTKIAGFNLDKFTGEGGRAALDVLDETTRLGEATAGGFHSQIERAKEGKVPTPWHAAKGAWESGGSRTNRKTYADVLRVGGADKAFKAVLGDKAGGVTTEALGLVGDIGLDPTTFVTFGTAVPAKAGAKAAVKVAKKGANTVTAVVPARAVVAKKGAKKRVTVSAGGRTTVTPARVPEMSDEVREGLRKIFPLRPADMSEAEWAKLSDAGRRRRGLILSETRRSARKVTAQRKALGGARRRFLPEKPMEGAKVRRRPGRARTAPVEASRRVRDARESGKLRELSPAERAVLKEEVREDRRMLKMRREAGETPKVYRPVEAGDAKHYSPRLAAFAISDPGVRRKVGRAEGWAERRVPSPTGGTRQARKTSTEEDYARKVNRGPMSEVREAKPGFYVEDIPTVRMAKAQKDIGRAANTRYRNEVVSMGKPVTKKPGENAKAPVGEGEAVYRTDQGKLTLVKQDDVPGLANKQPGDLVVLRKSVADHANRQVEGSKRLPFIDPVTNRVKWLLTVPNPQYWSRNYYGGLFNAWEEGARGTGLAKSTVTAHKVARRMGKIAKAEETLGARPKKPAGTINLGKSGKMNVDKFIREVESQNVSGGGITSELLGAETRRRSRMQSFEDVPRLAAYIHWRRKGLSSDQATRRAMNSQFDYGALSAAEMNWAKRIFPFYTWRSRNIALQAKTLAQRPGKLATFEKTRNTLASGLPEDWQSKLQENEALGVPIPLPGMRQAVYPGLPITDLNLFTTDPAAWGQQMAGMSNPILKIPTEFFTNYSFFFRDHLEDDGRKWYSAPDRIINAIPFGGREALAKAGIIRKGRDTWTNEITWQWRGKHDYLAKLFPISSTALQVGTSGRSRKGQDSAQRFAGWMTGLRTAPLDFTQNALFDKYEQRADLYDKQDDIRELKTNFPRDKREYDRLQTKIDKLEGEIWTLEGRVGKKGRGENPRSSGGSSGSLLDSVDKPKSLLDAKKRSTSLLD